MNGFSRRSFIFMSLAVAACKRGAVDFVTTGNTMGTNYTVVALDPSGQLDQAVLTEGLEAALTEVDRQMSNWNPKSEISTINAREAGVSIALTPPMEHVLKAAQTVHHATNGQFDVTLGPAIDMWGFGATGQQNVVPDKAKSSLIMPMMGQDRAIKLSPGRIHKTTDKSSIYLSGIGKGYGVDRLAAVLRETGISDFMVEIGGDLFTEGFNRQGLPWKIAIETPDASRREVHRIVSVSGNGLATSGDYRNYFEHGGQRYSHILDATTGRPVKHATASVTVLAENAMLADAWATGLLAIGRQEGLEIAEEHGVAAYFIERSNQTSGGPFSATSSAHFSEFFA